MTRIAKCQATENLILKKKNPVAPFSEIQLSSKKGTEHTCNNVDDLETVLSEQEKPAKIHAIKVKSALVCFLLP